MDKNPQAQAMAFKKCQGKILKIIELGIKPNSEKDFIESLIEKLAVAKSEEDTSKTLAEHVKNQRWYVEGLVTFSGLGGADSTPENRAALQFEQEYQNAFANSASEAEMLEQLTALAA